MTEQIKPNSLASEAFAVFANYLASELAQETELLEAEVDRLTPLRDHLSSAEIHVDDNIIKSCGIGRAIISKEEDGLVSLMMGFPETPTPIPLLTYLGAKLMISNQVVATFPGHVYPFIKMYESDEFGICFAPCDDLSIGVEGLLGNLTDNDKAKLMEDDKSTLAEYLLHRTGLEGDITFSPVLIRLMTITPPFQKLIDLLGPLRTMTKDTPPQEPEFEQNKYYLNELSPYDELRDNVMDVYNNPEYMDLMSGCLFYKDEQNVLTEMRTLITTVSLDIDDETQLTVSLDDGVVGHDHLVENGGAVWAFCLTGRDIEVPIAKLQSLNLMVSGAKLTRSHVRIFPANTLLVLEIGFYSGIILRGFFDGLGATDLLNNFGDTLEQTMDQLMHGGELPSFSSDVVIKLFSLSLELASNGNLLNLLGLNIETNEEESSVEASDAQEDE